MNRITLTLLVMLLSLTVVGTAAAQAGQHSVNVTLGTITVFSMTNNAVGFTFANSDFTAGTPTHTNKQGTATNTLTMTATSNTKVQASMTGLDSNASGGITLGVTFTPEANKASSSQSIAFTTRKNLTNNSTTDVKALTTSGNNYAGQVTVNYFMDIDISKFAGTLSTSPSLTWTVVQQ